MGRGTAPPQTPPSRRLRRLDSRVFGARPANVPVALTPMPTNIDRKAAAIDRTDRRTTDRYIDPSPHTRTDEMTTETARLTSS